MLNRFQPVAWMIATPDDPLPRSKVLQRQHLAELRRENERASLVRRMIDALRGPLAPTRAATLEPACCPA